jgi:hypothetical protein
MKTHARVSLTLLALVVFGGQRARAQAPAPVAPAAPVTPVAPPAPSTASLATAAKPPVEPPPFPHLKVSYRRFAIANLDLTHVPLQGVQVDAYPASTQWGRGGFEVEAGVGHAELNGVGVDARYGLIGFTAALQYAAPITPFVEGRLVGGILSGNIDGSLAVAAATSSPAASVGSSATTFIYGDGIDAGAEIFAIGHAYVSLSIGWLHTTWQGIDYAAVVQNPSADLRLMNLSADSFTFKLGIGI